jgi:hypothetical protein
VDDTPAWVDKLIADLERKAFAGPDAAPKVPGEDAAAPVGPAPAPAPVPVPAPIATPLEGPTLDAPVNKLPGLFDVNGGMPEIMGPPAPLPTPDQGPGKAPGLPGPFDLPPGDSGDLPLDPPGFPGFEDKSRPHNPGGGRKGGAQLLALNDTPKGDFGGGGDFGNGGGGLDIGGGGMDMSAVA